jgi:hypothetical protein
MFTLRSFRTLSQPLQACAIPIGFHVCGLSQGRGLGSGSPRTGLCRSVLYDCGIQGILQPDTPNACDGTLVPSLHRACKIDVRSLLHIEQGERSVNWRFELESGESMTSALHPQLSARRAGSFAIRISLPIQESRVRGSHQLQFLLTSPRAQGENQSSGHCRECHDRCNKLRNASFHGDFSDLISLDVSDCHLVPKNRAGAPRLVANRNKPLLDLNFFTVGW